MTLIKRYTEYSMEIGNTGDLPLVYATEIEDNLIEAGAKGGIDYTILDCFKLAFEYKKAQELEKIAKNILELEPVEYLDVNVYKGDN
jgi:hypothetical protein